MQAESDEGESRATAAAAATGLDFEGSSDFLMYMDMEMDMEESVFLDEEDASVVTSSCHFALPEPAVFQQEATPHPNPAGSNSDRSWEEAMSSMDDIFAEETAQWLEQDPSGSDDEECGKQPEDIESYLISPSSPEQEKENDILEEIAEKGEGEVKSSRLGNDVHEAAEEAKNMKKKNNKISEVEQATEDTPEAAVLRQLEDVATKLDRKTRFCIRDAFYRLAESAARRHGADDTSGDVTNPAIEQLSSVTSRFGERVETSTNSIDRTIASLLFHRQQQATSGPQQTSPPSQLIPQTSTVYSSSKIPLPPVHRHRCCAVATAATGSAKLQQQNNNSSFRPRKKNKVSALTTSAATTTKKLPLPPPNHQHHQQYPQIQHQLQRYSLHPHPRPLENNRRKLLTTNVISGKRVKQNGTGSLAV